MSTALVTGASAGLGEEFARQLAARGHDLVLVARDEARLVALSAALTAEHGVRAEVLAADLCADDGRARVEARLASTDAPIELLVNNAGVMEVGAFAAADVNKQVREVELNVVALVRLTHAALNAMSARRTGTIMNISSVAGFQPSPSAATYAATKAFVNSFTHALYEEARGEGVHVMAVCPGYTHTELHERAGLDPSSGVPELFWQSADEVVSEALRALDRRRSVSVPGAINKVIAAGSSVTPAIVSRRIAGIVVKRT
ncbi:MAG: SDR family oxidoreductase [Acidimicrobiia bacterium]